MAGVKNDGMSSASRRTSRAERRSIVEEYRASGLTQKEFSARRQVPLSTLTQWLRQERGSRPNAAGSSPVHFQSFPLPESPAWAAEVRRGDGTLLRFSAGAGADLVHAVLKATR
jgi:transposase-like protein